MKRMLIFGLLILPLLCTVPIFSLALLTNGQTGVHVITIPVPGGRGVLLVSTPCRSDNSGSIGLWTTRPRITGVHVIPLRTWPEQRDFFGGIVNRLVLRISTFRHC